MKCREIQDLLSPYIDGQLSGKEMADVREHLLLCPECNREYLLLKEMTELLGTLEFKALPVGFDADFRAALELEGKLARAGGGESEGTAISAEMKESEMEDSSQTKDELNARRKRYLKYGAIAAAFLVCVFSVVTALFYGTDFTGDGTDLTDKADDLLLAEGDAGIDGNDTGAEVQKDESASQAPQPANPEGASGGETSRIGKENAAGGNESIGSDRVSAGSKKTEGLRNDGAASGATDGVNLASAKADTGESVKESGGETGGSASDDFNDESAGGIPASKAAPMMEAADGAAGTDSVPEAASEGGGSPDASSAGSGNSSVIDAAYAAGAKTYNEALDFVSFIADNDRGGLIRWIMTHSVEKLTEEQAGQLADGYIAKYKSNAN